MTVWNEILDAIAGGWREVFGDRVSVSSWSWLEEEALQLGERIQMAPIRLTGWLPGYPDPEYYLRLLFQSTSRTNEGGFADPVFDELIEKKEIPVLIGVFVSIVLELCGMSSLAFAVGVYLPPSPSTPLMVGGLVRHLAPSPGSRQRDVAGRATRLPETLGVETRRREREVPRIGMRMALALRRMCGAAERRGTRQRGTPEPPISRRSTARSCGMIPRSPWSSGARSRPSPRCCASFPSYPSTFSR